MAVFSSAVRRTAISVAVVGLLVGGVLAPVVTDEAVAQQAAPEADNTVTRIEVSENGSARWTIQIRTRLDTDQRVDEYTAFQARFRTDTTRYLGPFRTRMQGVVANAENATGREMRARNFTASTSIQEVPRRWGVVTYEFTWTNFAARENGRVIVGDVFQGGFFIAANDTLQVVVGGEYAIARVEPDPDSREPGMVTWLGREDFADAHPRVVFAPTTDRTERTDGNATGTSSAVPGTEDESVLETLGGLALLGLVLVLLLGAAGVAMYGRSDSGTAGASDPGEDGDGRPESSSTAGAAVDTGGQRTGRAVLTDAERVIELLEANGGRMRQAAIAEEFDWSASKTSRVVGRMSDDGSVEKLQLGRENLVALPDEKP